MSYSKTRMTVLTLLVVAGLLLAACATPTAQVIREEVTKIVEVTKEVEVVKEVEVTKVVEKEVEKVVKETVEVEKETVVTATPAPLKEAPQLRGLVQAGELPPLEERRLFFARRKPRQKAGNSSRSLVHPA